MNKAALVTSVEKITGHTKVSVEETIAAMFHAVKIALSKGERVTIVGFGTFERRQRPARRGVNPRDPNQRILIEAAKVPKFRPGQELKDAVDGRLKLPAIPKRFAKTKKTAANGAPKSTSMSDAKVWWQCAKNPKHHWQCKVSTQKRKGACPFCASKSS